MSVFRRKTPQKFWRRGLNMIWPQIGWRRYFLYLKHRLFRHHSSVYSIVAGLASGAAVSWSPFLGSHFIQAAILSKLLNANVIAGLMGTAWGNPWTFPFIFWINFKLGSFMCAAVGWNDIANVSDALEKIDFLEHPWQFTLYILSHPLDIFVPLILGGFVTGTVFWILSYGILYYPVKAIKNTYDNTYRKGIGITS